MDLDPPGRSPFRNLSVVWLVPVLALLVSVGVAWKSFSDRGTLISISFPAAAGIVPGETTVQFRDVVIGTVEDVRFAADFQSVRVDARIDKDVAQTLAPDSQFWVVRPIVSTRGITGLSTVLSGVHIEGAWEPVKGSRVRAFQGLAQTPIVRPGREGTRITLRSKDASLLPEGAPVYFHGVEVGNLDVPRLTPSGDSAVVEAFINAPHDRFITTATRFWDTSGFSVKLGPGGVDLNVASVGALLTGGVAFDNTFTGGQPLTNDTVFNIFLDEDSARQSIFTQVGDNALPVAIVFSGSVNGLSAGAPVDYGGLRVGQVTGVSAFIETSPSGARVVRIRTAAEIDPQALGLDPATGKTEVQAFLRDAVSKGLRARLTTTSIFSAALKIELIELPDEPAASIEQGDDGVPILPSVQSDLPDFTATAEGVLQRINALPIEEVMQQAISLMASIEAVAASDGTRAAPEALVKLLEDSRAFLNKDDTQALPTELRAAVADLRKVVSELQERGAVEKLVSVLESADKIAADVAAASKDFPNLVTDLRDLAAKAKALKAEELVDRTTSLLASAEAVIDSDAARALPADLSAALAEVQAALKELREGGAVTNANAALASAKDAAESVAAAADDLPKLTDELESLVKKADGLIASYGGSSKFNSEALDLLRDLQAAAKAVTQLARTIERNPNSLLIGR
jgi:paraquat-inducible protein B